MDNYSQIMMIENSLKNKSKQFAKWFEEKVINPKNYSFVVVDKSAPIDRRYIYYDSQKKMYSYENPFKDDNPSRLQGKGTESSEEEESQKN